MNTSEETITGRSFRNVPWAIYVLAAALFYMVYQRDVQGMTYIVALMVLVYVARIYSAVTEGDE